jgi:hypothetical protein
MPKNPEKLRQWRRANANTTPSFFNSVDTSAEEFGGINDGNMQIFRNWN